MAKAGKILIWSLIIGGAAVGIYYIVKAIRDKNKDSENDDTQTPPDTGGGYASVPCTVVWPLQNGSGSGSRICESDYVKAIQKYLNKLVPNKTMSVDGDWGNTTEKYITALLGINAVNESQYNLIKAGKNPVSKPEKPPYTFNITAGGVTYSITLKDPMTNSQKDIIITGIMQYTGLADTKDRREKMRKYAGTYLGTWWYYLSKGYPTFIYNGDAYYSSSGLKVSL